MKIGEPLMITDMGISFCEAPVIVDEEVMVPIIDVLEGFGAEFDEKTSTYTLMWIAE
ncbi:MAG: hypothetical protein R2883_03600 [Caldisericia bacterium]